MKLFVSRVPAPLAASAAALALASLASSRPAGVLELVSFGDTITQPGTYILAGDQSGSGDGIVVASGGVVLRLGGHTLSGDGTGRGVVVDGYDHVTITGGRIRGFEDGVELTDAARVTVERLRIERCDDDGITGERADFGVFRRLDLDDNGGDGLDLEESSYCLLDSVACRRNGDDGVALGTADVPTYGNVLQDCLALDNDADGFELDAPTRYRVLRNRSLGNGADGIDLDVGDTGGENLVRFNVTLDNGGSGIEVSLGIVGSTIAFNQAFGNDESAGDLREENPGPPCANLWIANLFGTAGGDGAACID